MCDVSSISTLSAVVMVLVAYLVWKKRRTGSYDVNHDYDDMIKIPQTSSFYSSGEASPSAPFITGLGSSTSSPAHTFGLVVSTSSNSSDNSSILDYKAPT